MFRRRAPSGGTWVRRYCDRHVIDCEPCSDAIGSSRSEHLGFERLRRGLRRGSGTLRSNGYGGGQAPSARTVADGVRHPPLERLRRGSGTLRSRAGPLATDPHRKVACDLSIPHPRTCTILGRETATAAQPTLQSNSMPGWSPHAISMPRSAPRHPPKRFRHEVLPRDFAL
jgi:hypothetical protein